MCRTEHLNQSQMLHRGKRIEQDTCDGPPIPVTADVSANRVYAMVLVALVKVPSNHNPASITSLASFIDLYDGALVAFSQPPSAG